MSTRPELTVLPVSLNASAGGRYTVRAGASGDSPVMAVTAAQVVAAAVLHLPDGLGPVTACYS